MSFADSFRAARWLRTLNLMLQAVLFTTLFSGLNYLAMQYALRFDLTQYRRYSLSPETKSYLNSLRAPVRIVVTLTDDPDNADRAQAFRDIAGLLREFVYQAENNYRPEIGRDGRITVEFLDVFQRRLRAQELGIENPNTIMVLSGDKRRAVGLEELYQIENAQKKAFKAEQSLTNAILNVSTPTEQKVYFVQGHGEMQPEKVDKGRGLSQLREVLRIRNFSVRTLELARERGVPADAALLVIASPTARYEPIEEEWIRAWLANNAGRLILLLSPGQAHGLDNLLRDWGLVSEDVQIYDEGPDGQNETGDLILRSLSDRSPITAPYFSNPVTFRFGSARPARPDSSRRVDTGLQVEPLVATSATAWGERDRVTNRAPRFDPAVDIKGPLVVASSSERLTPPKDLPFSVRGGRVVLFGDSDFIANGRIDSGGNLGLFLSAVNWTVDRDLQLAVRPRPIERYQLSLTQQELANLRYSLILGVPGAAALLGLIVYWTRRR